MLEPSGENLGAADAPRAFAGVAVQSGQLKGAAVEEPS
jgi:hypothetical protein